MSTKTTQLVELTAKELTQATGGGDPYGHYGYYDPAYQEYLHYYYHEYLPYYYSHYDTPYYPYHHGY